MSPNYVSLSFSPEEQRFCFVVPFLTYQFYNEVTRFTSNHTAHGMLWKNLWLSLTLMVIIKWSCEIYPGPALIVLLIQFPQTSEMMSPQYCDLSIYYLKIGLCLKKKKKKGQTSIKVNMRDHFISVQWKSGQSFRKEVVLHLGLYLIYQGTERQEASIELLQWALIHFHKTLVKNMALPPLQRWVKWGFCPCKLCAIKQMSWLWELKLCLYESPVWMMMNLEPPGGVCWIVGQNYRSIFLCLSLQESCTGIPSCYDWFKEDKAAQRSEKNRKGQVTELSRSILWIRKHSQKGKLCGTQRWGCGMEECVQCVNFIEAP